MAQVAGAPAIIPADKYVPFDWAVSEIRRDGDGLKLTWNQDKTTRKSRATPGRATPGRATPGRATLRLTSATDVREEIAVDVKTSASGRMIGTFDIRFAMYLQPFELPIPAADLALVLAEGVTLTMVKGSKPFWFFRAGDAPKSAPNAYLPHLLIDGNQDERPGHIAQSATTWKDRLLSLESVQTFGWMQGVVWDGLLEMSKQSATAKSVLEKQLDLYFGQNSLVYCNLNNIKTVEKISTVESILPFAILAQTNPTHPLLKTAVAFCENHANAEGVIADGTGNNRTVKTEECYTVSYPLAVLAKTLNRPELAQLAINTLQSRINLLEKGNSIHQRGTEQGELYFENWGRGVAWYLLGIAKTLTHLPDSDQKQTIQKSFQKSVEKVIAYQQPNGLWFNFFNKPETGLETSGTAGIAAALIYGFQNRLLSKSAKNAADKAQNGLLPFLTPDGFLIGTAQVNKGGDALQLNGFRVISPYTLGFLAHFDRN